MTPLEYSVVRFIVTDESIDPVKQEKLWVSQPKVPLFLDWPFPSLSEPDRLL